MNRIKRFMVEIKIAMVIIFMVVILIVMMMTMMAMTTMMINLATTINLSKRVWERKKGGARCRRQELCLSCLSRPRQ